MAWSFVGGAACAVHFDRQGLGHVYWINCGQFKFDRAGHGYSLTDALTDTGYSGYQVAGNVRPVLQHLVSAKLRLTKCQADQSRAFRLKLD